MPTGFSTMPQGDFDQDERALRMPLAATLLLSLVVAGVLAAAMAVTGHDLMSILIFSWLGFNAAPLLIGGVMVARDEFLARGRSRTRAPVHAAPAE
jgi:hypothetical protein